MVKTLASDDASFVPSAPPIVLRLTRSNFFLMVVTATLVYNVMRTEDFSAIITSQVQVTQGQSLHGGGIPTTERSLEQTAHNNNSNDPQTTTTTTTASLLPSCASLMQAPHSPYRDGAFLTRHTIPITWLPRADGSRELKHSMCELHRYTAPEARRCLAGKHVTTVGDSLSRYQFMSLVWFLHKGTYPPHFGRPGQTECTHKDERGRPTCSPEHQPNICMEGDWARGNPVGDPWRWLMQSVGGLDTNNVFDGSMEAQAIRTKVTKDPNVAENYMYVSPPPAAQNNNSRATADAAKWDLAATDRFMLTYFKETGWHASPRPINGFDFTGCAYYGNCSYSNELAEEHLRRGMNTSWDFDQPLAEALNETSGGVLYTKIPPVDISLYNRGLWGVLSKDQAATLMPLFHQLSRRGRCYYRATTGKFSGTLEPERTYVKFETNKAGCGYVDFAHLVEDFNQLNFLHPRPPTQRDGNGGEYRATDERITVYWDAVHFMPWVYEELNNMLLNVWCNHQLKLPLETQIRQQAESSR